MNRQNKFVVKCKKCNKEREVKGFQYSEIISGNATGVCLKCSQQKIKRVIFITCPDCGDVREVSTSMKSKIKIGKNSKKCRSCAQTGIPKLCGYKHHWWKGGITPLIRLIRTTPKYARWRSDVFERDNWACQTCQKRGCELEAHHKNSFHKIIQENNLITWELARECDELWDLDNGITLCIECHKICHRRS